MTWADTAWGKVCKALHAYLLPAYPALVLGIGQDAFTLHEGRPRVLFLGPGMVVRAQTVELVVPDETLEECKRVSRLGKRALWDRVCPVVCRIAVPFAGSETIADTSQEACEDLYERMLAAIYTIAHIRASDVAGAKWMGGTIGRNGTAVDLSFALRFTVYDNALPSAKPTSTQLSQIETTDPNGQTTSVAVPGG